MGRLSWIWKGKGVLAEKGIPICKNQTKPWGGGDRGGRWEAGMDEKEHKTF